MMRDVEYGARQNAFRDRLCECGAIIATVNSPGELEVAMLHALIKLSMRRRRRTLSIALTYRYALNLGNESFIRLAPPREDLPRKIDFSLTPIAALRDDYQLVPFWGRDQQELVEWTRLDMSFAMMSITGRSGVGKSRLARELCAQLETLGWHVGFAEAVKPTGVHDALDLETPVLIVVDIDSDTRNAKVAVKVIKNLSATALRHPVRLVVIARALAGQAWEKIRRVAEPRGVYTERQISLDRIVLSDTDQATHYQSAFEAFSGIVGRAYARLDLDQSHEVPSSEGAFDFIGILRRARFGQNAVDLRSILAHRVDGTPRSILLVHLAALLDVLDGEHGRTEVAGPHLLDALIRRETAYWKTQFDRLGLAAKLQLDIVAVASFAAAETKRDAKRLLRSLGDLGDASEERLGAIADVLNELSLAMGSSLVQFNRIFYPRGSWSADYLRKISCLESSTFARILSAYT